jgi:hypothetical protein
MKTGKLKTWDSNETEIQRTKNLLLAIGEDQLLYGKEYCVAVWGVCLPSDREELAAWVEALRITKGRA